MSNDDDREEKDEEKARLLILDLDSTCVFSQIMPVKEVENTTIPDGSHVFTVEGDTCITQLRPGLHVFLQEVAKDWHLAVWSASSRSYIDEIVSRAFPIDIKLQFIYDRSHCKRKRMGDSWGGGCFDGSPVLTKPLAKVWRSNGNKYNRGNTIIIDDTPITYSANYGNALPIKAFMGTEQEKEKDEEFKRLLRILDEKKSLSDVRCRRN